MTVVNQNDKKIANSRLHSSTTFKSSEEFDIIQEIITQSSTYIVEENKNSEYNSNDEEEKSFTPNKESERKLVRKINYTFIPFVCFILFIQYVDKATLQLVSVLPQFYADTGITKDEYAWLGSMFYLGFLIMQIPNSYMLQKIPLSKYVGIVLMIWGISLLCMAFAHNFSQLAALRCLLGFFEAVTYPAMFLLTATLYRRSEQVIWFGVMFISNGVALIIGNLIGVGIMQLPTVNGISAWKWTFIIFGVITSVMGLVYTFFLPDKPTSKWFRLTKEEEMIVVERIRDNAVVPTKKINYKQVKEVLRELRFYLYCLISLLLCLQNGALGIFTSIIIADMGFSSSNAILLTIPSGAVSSIIIFLAIIISKRKNEVILVAMTTCAISMTGLIILMTIPSSPVKLLGIYLSWGATTSYVLLQTSISSNVSGYTKRIFYTSSSMVFYTIGNFIGPLLLRSQDSPRYLEGIGVFVVANAIVICLFAYIRYSYVQTNKRHQLVKSTNTVALPDDLEDMTDVENKNFVYRT